MQIMRIVMVAMVTLMLGLLISAPVPLLAQENTADESPVDLERVESEDGTARYVAVPKEGVVLEQEKEGVVPPDLSPVYPETTQEVVTSQRNIPAEPPARIETLSGEGAIGVAGGAALLGTLVFLTHQHSKKNS